MTRLRLNDLRVNPPDLEEELAAVRRVLERGWFVLGPEVTAFEQELAAASGAAAAVGVASGTDALSLGLRALGVGPGDEVIVPGFTAFPTAVAVIEAGATPVFVDVESDTPHLALSAMMAAITPRTRAVILVHLYGIPADSRAFKSALDPLGIHLVEDCAQAQGAHLDDGSPVGSTGAFGAFSFYPTKNLGAVGDGGAVVTQNLALAEEVRAWRSHGEREVRYRHELQARNSRLDEVHAAVLRLRLQRLDSRVAVTRALALRYGRAISSFVEYGESSAPHLAVIRTPGLDPDDLARDLAAKGIPTGRHYPLALDEQPSLQEFAPEDPLVSSRAWASSCLTLPLHPQLSPSDVDHIIEVVHGCISTST